MYSNCLELTIKGTTGGEFRVYRASIRLLKGIDLLQGSYNGNYPPDFFKKCPRDDGLGVTPAGSRSQPKAPNHCNLRFGP